MKSQSSITRKKIRVLLVYPNLMLQTTFPLALSIFSAILKQNGYEVDVFDTTFYKTEDITSDEYRVKHLQIRKFSLDPEFKNLKTKKQMLSDFEQKIKDFKPDLIAFSILEDLYPLSLELINISKHFHILTIAGGLFPTFAPEKMIAIEGIDIICIGDGEQSLLELCNRLSAGKDYRDIRNLWIKRNSHIYKNPIRPPQNLDKNPPPDFLIFDDRRFYRPMKGRVYRIGIVETNRGCAYTCNFCNSYGQAKFYREEIGEKYFRIKDVGVIHNEIKELVEKHRVEFIYFTAEVLFLMNKNYLKEFVKMYKKFRLPFFCQNRAEVINEETIKYLSEMNCHTCSMGIEHGNEEFRFKMLNRKVKNETYLYALKCFKNSNITVSINNIVGFPDETRELAFDSINLNRQLREYAYQINAYYYTPYHGTVLRQYCIDKGYISEDTQTSYINKDTVMNMPHFSADEIRGLVRTFTLYVRFPKERYPEIAIAERFDEEGNRKFQELGDLQYKHPVLKIFNFVCNFSYFIRLPYKKDLIFVIKGSKSNLKKIDSYLSYDCFRQICALALIRRYLKFDYKERFDVVVIGDGYGFLSSIIKKTYPNARITLIDIGKVLFFQAINLQLIYPEYNHILSTRSDNSGFKEFDFLYAPSEDISVINNIKFSLSINIASMQEMNLDSIHRYFKFLRLNSSKDNLFYCCNRRLKTLPGGEVIEFSKYPWHINDQHFIDEEPLFYRYFMSPYFPFVHYFEGRMQHRLTNLYLDEHREGFNYDS